MKYKCRFKFDYDDFMVRYYTFELHYKPKKLLATTRKIPIYADNSYASDGFDESINECMERIINMSQEDLMNIAIETIKENESIIYKEKSDENEFEKKLSEVNRKLNRFKFEVDI